MTLNHTSIDDTDWHILEELQINARISFSELGRRVGLSSPAVAERVRRLEDAGIISGYRAKIDLKQLGTEIIAFLSIKSYQGQSPRAAEAVKDKPEVLECHKVTGSQCYIMKIAVESVSHLEEMVDYMSRYGEVTTSIVLSSVVDDRLIESPVTAMYQNEHVG